MANVEQIHCFVDTNTLIHFPTFDEVDWPRHLGAHNVQLTIAPIVFSEVDSLKNDQSKRWRRTRARVIRDKLKKLIASVPPGQPAVVRRGVTLLGISREPIVDWASEGLDPERPDDRLVASVVCYRAEHPGATLLVLSNDFGPLMKASARAVPSRDPDDFLQPLPVASEEEVKIRKLEQENLALRIRFPEMKVGILQTHQVSEVMSIPRLAPREPWQSREELELEIDEEKRSCLEMVTPEVREAVPDKCLEYEGEVARYIEELREYAFRHRSYAAGLEVTLHFAVANGGTAQATDVEASIFFPEDTLALKAEDVRHPRRGVANLQRPERPRAPASPKRVSVADLVRAYEGMTLADVPAFPSIDHSRLSLLMPPLLPEKPSAPGPECWLGLHSAHLFLPKLKAKDHWVFEPITAYLPPEGSVITLNYQVHATELPDRTYGTVKIEFV